MHNATQQPLNVSPNVCCVMVGEGVATGQSDLSVQSPSPGDPSRTHGLCLSWSRVELQAVHQSCGVYPRSFRPAQQESVPSVTQCSPAQGRAPPGRRQKAIEGPWKANRGRGSEWKQGTVPGEECAPAEVCLFGLNLGGGRPGLLAVQRFARCSLSLC
ncbi:unnamed protein product [Gadus morhua 'NCC']